MKYSTVIGIDYSMTHPALCIIRNNDVLHPLFRYLTDRATMVRTTPMVLGKEHRKWCCDEERFFNIADWAVDIVKSYPQPIVILEGYSMGSQGRVFNIAENTGLLKHTLWSEDIQYIKVAPTSVKKFFAETGRADKKQMVDAFLNKKLFDYDTNFGFKNPYVSPFADIVDSYAIAMLGIEKLKETNDVSTPQTKPEKD